MACGNYTLSGISKTACESNVGGIKVVYIALAEEVTAITFDSGTTMVTGITMSGATKFKEYYFRKNTGSMTATLNTSDEGANYITTELSLRFSKMETAKRLEMRALTLADFVVIVKDCNDKYWLLGNPTNEEFVTASAGTGETGQNRDDSNAYTLTLGCESAEFPFEVTATAVAAVIPE